jgi:hypothetical protein
MQDFRWPGLCYLYASLCLLLWPGLCGPSMVWTMRLPMLASMIHRWATIRGKSSLVTNSLYIRCAKLPNSESELVAVTKTTCSGIKKFRVIEHTATGHAL